MQNRKLVCFRMVACREQYSLRPRAHTHTPGHNGRRLIDREWERHRWDEQKEENTTRQEVTEDYCWLSEKEQRWRWWWWWCCLIQNEQHQERWWLTVVVAQSSNSAANWGFSKESYLIIMQPETVQYRCEELVCFLLTSPFTCNYSSSVSVVFLWWFTLWPLPRALCTDFDNLRDGASSLHLGADPNQEFYVNVLKTHIKYIKSILNKQAHDPMIYCIISNNLKM